MARLERERQRPRSRALERVCHPLELGGLGILDLQRSGVALRMRWLWPQRIDPSRPWVHLHLPSDPDASSVFQASITWTVGNGHTCDFWTDPWIDDKAISDLAPSLLPLVARRRCKSCSVTDGLQGRSWVADIRGRAHARCYDPVCPTLEASSARTPFYSLSWRSSTDGCYFAKSCYVLFTGSKVAPFWCLTWRSWALHLACQY